MSRYTYTLSWVFILLLCTVISLSLYIIQSIIPPFPNVVMATTVLPEKNISEKIFSSENITTIRFVGDIMLGRYVEQLTDKYGDDYSFKGVHYILSEPDITIGNFEGNIPRVHSPTPPGDMHFSMSSKTMSRLAQEGFDVLSLANNHSYDNGHSAYLYTQKMCIQSNIICGGDHQFISPNNSHIITYDGVRIGILFLYTVFTQPTSDELEQLFAKIRDISDVQIAYIHWGDEYKLKHNSTQEKLAHELIDIGIDVIVGHHPHVIQDIEIYKNVPIFYSLGNFIFDQYFSVDVQEGLILTLEYTKTKSIFSLSVISSQLTHSQPWPASVTKQHSIFNKILTPLEGNAQVNVASGTISITQ